MIYIFLHSIFVKYLRVSYCVFWSCSFSSLNCPRSPPTSLPTQFCVLFPPHTHWVLFVLAKYSWMWGHLLEDGQPVKDDILKENLSEQLSVPNNFSAPGGTCAYLHSPHWDFVWLTFTQVLCILPQLLWVHRWNHPVVFGKHLIFIVIHHLFDDYIFYDHIIHHPSPLLWLYLSLGSRDVI